MSDQNPLKTGVKSPWGGADVFVLPNSDAAATADGWPAKVIELTRFGRMVRVGSKLYVRHMTWERVRAEFAVLGARH